MPALAVWRPVLLAISVGSLQGLKQPWRNLGYSIHRRRLQVCGVLAVSHFDLFSSTIVTQTASHLDIDGTGIVSGNGFTPTAMDWSFSTQSSGGIPRVKFSFSADANAVPDGGNTVMLLGATLGALGMARCYLIG
jgi:hypothetical protein